MRHNNFFTKKDTLSSLKLNAVEHCVLSDMKNIIDKLDKDDLNHLTSLFENHNKKIFDDFFLSLGSKRSKELLNLLLKIKTMVNNNSFEIEVFLFYLCIENPCLVNLLFFDKDTHICSDDEEHNCFDGPIPTIDQQFEKIKKSLKLFLENDSSKIKY
ncbi:P52 family lipoprotein [Borreliella valaisiana]|uniref:P52 family lipoprotein n=1 Tax=Borreliella valaisiana TaxID=62088 RepID=UPI001B34D051|nr:P52 family lipoprotein [Borreliella valaisiana]